MSAVPALVDHGSIGIRYVVPCGSLEKALRYMALLLLASCESEAPQEKPIPDTGEWFSPCDSGTGAIAKSSDEDGDGVLPCEGDCDDSNADVSPYESEKCNGVDDDCDGAIDEDVATSFYRDRDGDGYGEPGTATPRCEATSGYVANDSDCDDTNASVSPVATEACDGIDNNCSGSVDEGCP